MAALSGRRVLVTGAGGFIGGHLCEALVDEGVSVRAFVRYNSRGDRGALDHLPASIAAEIEVTAGDLRDAESVSAAVQGCEVVFHLAAQIAIPYSYVNPRDYVETNVLGSLNVAVAARALDVERVVHTSTSEVYGTARSVPITEDHPLEPQSPYAASKVGADKLMDSYHRAFGLPVTILRPFNTYGPGQSARAVIPTIVTQALAGSSVKLGSVTPRRDLTYVSDTVRGFICAASAPDAVGSTIQLGTGQSVSIAELVDTIGALLGTPLVVETDAARIRPDNSEVELLLSDPALARDALGWDPVVSLEDGLRQTIEWIRLHASQYRVGEYAI